MRSFSNYWLWFLLFLLTTGCKVSSRTQIGIEGSDDMTQGPGLVLIAKDLSENFSRFSTKNDEILLLLYEEEDPLSQPLLDTLLVFDESRNAHQLPFSWEIDLLLVLVEMDTEKNIQQIEPLIRIHQKELEVALASRDYNAIERLIGDEDYLGQLRLKVVQKHERASISGVHKLDQYRYEVAW